MYPPSTNDLTKGRQNPYNEQVPCQAVGHAWHPHQLPTPPPEIQFGRTELTISRTLLSVARGPHHVRAVTQGAHQMVRSENKTLREEEREKIKGRDERSLYTRWPKSSPGLDFGLSLTRHGSDPASLDSTASKGAVATASKGAPATASKGAPATASK